MLDQPIGTLLGLLSMLGAIWAAFCSVMWIVEGFFLRFVCALGLTVGFAFVGLHLCGLF